MDGDINIMHGNEMIPFSSQATKPLTKSCAEKNCDDRQRGTFWDKVSSVKVRISLSKVRTSKFFA